MYNPRTVAFEIRNPFVKADRWGFKSSLITIWHHDPETDGTDDSCGWFIRARHIDHALLATVRKEFEFNFKHRYWFDVNGLPKFSTMGIALEMYSKAAMVIFRYQNGGKPDHKQYNKFMRKNLFEILHFAENPTDSLAPSINKSYGFEELENRINAFVHIITSDIIRKQRKWWQHPRWHMHHWRLQFHPFQQLKRRYWDKCSVCKKRGFKGGAMGDWSGSKIWHQSCDNTAKTPR
jgi:hypothetical protein